MPIVDFLGESAAIQFLSGFNIGDGAISLPGGGITTLWLATFGTAQAPPMPASFPVDIGVLEKVLDTNNNVSVASGRLDFAGASAVNFDNPVYIGKTAAGAGFARANSRAFKFEFEVKTAVTRPAFIGLSNSATPSSGTDCGVYFAGGGGANIATPGGFVGMDFTWTLGTYTFTVLELSDGFALFGKGGAIGSTWKLIWVNHVTSSATLYPAFHGVGTTDYEVERAALVAGLGGVFAGDYNLATLRDTSVASGDTFVGNANGIHQFDFTLEGNPDANDEVALNFRRQDANNKIRAIVKRNAGDTAWDFQVRVVTAGTPATPSGWTDVTGVGTPDAIIVTSDGTNLAFYTKAGAVATKRGATLTNSSFQAETGLEIEAAAGNTLSAVTSYPRTSSNYDILDTI